MGIFSKVLRRNMMDINSIEDVLLRSALTGETVGRESAMQIPVISGYVDLICNTFAMIPFNLYEDKTAADGHKTTKLVTDRRVALINDDPGDTLDAFQMKKAVCEDYLLGKGGYIYINRVGNDVRSLHYVQESQVAININSDPIFKAIDIYVNGNVYTRYDFLKLLRNTKDGGSGISLISEINQALQTAATRLRYEYELTATGGSRKGFLKSSKKIDGPTMKALKQAWEDYYAGNSNTVILNDGIEFQEASNTSHESEMDAKNHSFIDEMGIIFHVGKSWNDFVKNAILPIATAFTSALNRDLLLEREKGSFYFVPDMNELYKGSIKERYEAYQIAIKNGFKTRNEIRYLEDDDYIEGLDVMTLGLGEVLLDINTGEIYTPNTNATVKLGEDSPEGGGEQNEDTNKE